MPNVQCPLPRALTSVDAKGMYDTVRKEMAGLTPAAWRREAARRLGTDYDTFLAAWKASKGKGTTVTPDPTPPKVGGTPKSPTPDPPKPPGSPGPGTAMTRDEARTLERRVAKELGLTPGSAAARKAAADRAGMRYDDFLAAWKGQKPKVPGEPIPDPKAPTKPKVDDPPVKPDAPVVKLDKRSVNTWLEGKGWKRAKTGKERRTHTGQSYGGGVSTSEGFEVVVDTAGELRVYFRPGYLSRDEAQAKMAKLTADLEAAGLHVTKESTLTLHIAKKASLLQKRAADPIEVEKALTKSSLELSGPARKWQPEVYVDKGTTLIRFASDAPEVAVDVYTIKLQLEGYKVTKFFGGVYRIENRKEWSTPASVRKLWDDHVATNKMATKKVPDNGSISPVNSKAIRDEISDQFSYVGADTADRFKKVTHGKYDPVERDYLDKNPNVLAYYRPGFSTGSRQMYVGDAALRGAVFSARHRSMQRNGWFSECGHDHNNPTSGVRNVVAHEFGHFANDMMPYNRLNEVFDEMGKDMGLDEHDIGAWKLATDKDALEASMSYTGRQVLKRYISNYGASNRFESFAEIWAEYTKAGSAARPHIMKWGTMLQDILEDM